MFKSIPTKAIESNAPTAQSFPPDSAWALNTPYTYQGLTFTLEILKGGIRKGTNPEGKEWQVTMPAAYGFFPGVIGADKEDLDVYVADPFNDAQIYIVDQINPKTNQFDEHKVMLGFASQDEASSIYQSVFSDGSGLSRMGFITPMSVNDFKTWITGDLSKPVSWKPPAAPTPDRTISEVKLLGDASGAPLIQTCQGPTGLCVDIFILSAFDADRWGRAADDIVRILQTASPGDVITISIASPGGEVSLASRIASAMEMTKAHVITRAYGLVASAACLLWVEGHEREIAPASYFMQHMSSHGDMGKTVEIARRAVAMARYVRDVILSKALDIGLFTDEEVSDMIDKRKDIYLSSRDVAMRTGAKILNREM